MCEFKVTLDNKVIARKIIKAKLKDNVVVMVDTAGNVTRVENAAIQHVDTIMAELELYSVLQ